MAYLIDETYFQRELFVPNADDTDRSAYTELQEFIDNKSRLLLKEVLGYTLFKDLDQNITNGILDAGAPQKWLNLVNGVEYVKDGYTYYWEGLLVQEGAFKKSLLANFVFYHWLYYKQTKYTYSEYRRNGIKVIDWVGNNTNDYYSSLIMFLSDNEETYAKAPLKMYHTINQFGL